MTADACMSVREWKCYGLVRNKVYSSWWVEGVCEGLQTLCNDVKVRHSTGSAEAVKPSGLGV